MYLNPFRNLFTERLCNGFDFRGSVVDFTRQAVTQIIFANFICTTYNFFEALTHIVKFRSKSQTVFHFKKLTFGSLNGITHSLSGNAFVLGNFSKRQIIIIVIFQKTALLFRQHISVKIQQNGDFQILCQKSAPSRHAVKLFSLQIAIILKNGLHVKRIKYAVICKIAFYFVELQK